MAFYENKTCFYKLETKRNSGNDYVAVGSDGNILAWKESEEDVQKWLIVPDEDGRCTIITKQNGEHMAVGSNGNILRWAATGGKEQQFTFIFDTSNSGWYNIEEHTKGERVAVGSNGNILRWGKTGHDDQRFCPIEVDPVPAPVVDPTGEVYNPGAIPNPPTPNYQEKILPPESSERYFIGNIILPSVYVRDSKYIGKADMGLLDQVIGSPYYLLRREQYWTRNGNNGSCEVKTIEGNGEDVTTTYKVEISESTEKTTESTLSMQFSIGGKVAFTKYKCSVSANICYELKCTEIEKDSVITTTEKTVSYHLDPGVKLIVVWEMIDSYSLYRMNLDGSIGELVNTWNNETSVIEEFHCVWSMSEEE